MVGRYHCCQIANETQFENPIDLNYSYQMRWFRDQLEDLANHEEYFWEVNQGNYKCREEFIDYIVSKKYQSNFTIKKIQVKESFIDVTTGEEVAKINYIIVKHIDKFTGRLKSNHWKKTFEINNSHVLFNETQSVKQIVYYDDQIQRELDVTQGKINGINYLIYKN
jgi:hypothetical protein